MTRVSFDRFDFDPRALELRADGEVIPLQQQPARILGLLLERPGELVTRDELRQAIWGDDRFVDFNRSLNFCVSQIRAALGDDAEEPRFVETLRGRGYRFIMRAPVVPEVPLVPLVPSVRQDLQTARRTRLHWAPLAVTATLLVAAVAFGTLSLRAGDVKAVSIAPFEASAGSEAWSSTLHTQIVAHLAHTPLRVIGVGASAGDDRAWILAGRVDQSDEQYRVTVTLRDADGAVRFSDIFDGPPGDWIEAQNEMARIISQAVRYNVEGPRAIDGIERRAPRRKIPFS